MTEQNSVKFGFIGRGAMHYSFNYQDVILEKINKETGCNAILTCITENKLFTIPDGSIAKIIKSENDIIHVVADCSSITTDVLNFTCSIDNNNYIQTYKLNEYILFRCRYNPKDIEIQYNNMKPTTSTWTFYDH